MPLYALPNLVVVEADYGKANGKRTTLLLYFWDDEEGAWKIFKDIEYGQNGWEPPKRVRIWKPFDTQGGYECKPIKKL